MYAEKEIGRGEGEEGAKGQLEKRQTAETDGVIYSVRRFSICKLAAAIVVSAAEATAAAQEKDDPQAAVVSVSAEAVSTAAAAAQEKNDPQTAVVPKTSTVSSCGVTSTSAVCST